ncbi:MAG: NAD(P)H-dependent glycerol-3-phosphate dehydrogenase [Clostridia bacterium]
MKVTVLGTGAFGIALARVLNKNENSVTMWTAFKDELDIVEKERENKKVLPGIKIPCEVELTTDLESAIDGAKLIVVAVPSGAIRPVAKSLTDILKEDQTICLMCKGLDEATGDFMSNIFTNETKHSKVAVLTGPSFAVDVATYKPVILTVASKYEKANKIIKQCFENENLKVEGITDIIGAQLGGSLKNVGAIGSGILDGMNCEPSTKAAYITSVLKEMVVFAKELGAARETMYAYCSLGDLILTCTSIKSRNFRLGKMIGEGLSVEEATKKLGLTVEGANTLEGVYKIVRKYNMNLPIIETMYDIIKNDADKERLIWAMMK